MRKFHFGSSLWILLKFFVKYLYFSKLRFFSVLKSWLWMCLMNKINCLLSTFWEHPMERLSYIYAYWLRIYFIGATKRTIHTSTLTKKQVEEQVSKWLVGARDHGGRRFIRAEKAKEKIIGLLTVNAIAWNCYIKFYRKIICARVEHFREDCCEALSELPFFHA